MATPVLTLAAPAGTHSRHRNAHKRARMIYNVRNHPEAFAESVRDIVNDTREAAVLAIGDMYDWDCDTCRMAVLTYTLQDPCPHCGRV